jgi:glucose/arabinose dehydrogenase
MLKAPRGDDRLFVSQQPGDILVRQPDGTTTVFIDIRSQTVMNQHGYGGLVSFAFHPDYATNGYIFLLYTNAGTGHPTLSRFQADPPTANTLSPATETVFYEWDIEDDTLHQETDLAFDPRTGYLYIALGDGSAIDSSRKEGARDMTFAGGKILRIDIDTPDGGAGTMYSIPADNPYATTGGGVLPEIWASGLRHPWRMSFDSQTHHLYIADVGRNVAEEINVEKAGSPGGKDFGWPLLEGNECESTNPSCDVQALITANNLTQPAHHISHDLEPVDAPCTAVVGGFVYRGSKIPELSGLYIYGDYCWHKVYSLRYNEADGTVSDVRDIGDDLELPEHGGASIQITLAAFGQDGHGELYILDYIVGRVFGIFNRNDVPPAELTE